MQVWPMSSWTLTGAAPCPADSLACSLDEENPTTVSTRLRVVPVHFVGAPMHHRGYGTQNLVASTYRPLVADSAVLRIRRWRGARSCRRLVPVWPGVT
jgi:hypothetical protein